jgi:hypothetical protein
MPSQSTHLFFFSKYTVESKTQVEENIFLRKWKTLPSLNNEISWQALTHSQEIETATPTDCVI